MKALANFNMDHPEYWVGVAVAIVLLVAAFFLWRRRLVVARPNEWLLVIKNGKMKSAGIGLQAFRGWKMQVVTFPSAIQQMAFRAQQVTREMQGIEVSGFVVWTVLREGDGPFRAYKYLEGLSDSGKSPAASENIARMAESIIRHQVANSTILEVISQREVLRDRIRSEMQEIVKGWGVWLETVEITDVRILSQNLFEDMQASYRQEMLREAESIRLRTEREIEEQRIRQNLELGKQRAEASEQQKLHEEQQALQREKMAARLLGEKLRIESENLEYRHSLQKLKQAYKMALDSVEADHGIELRQREVRALEGSPSAQQLEILRTLERMSEKLPLEQLNLYHLGGGALDFGRQILTQLGGETAAAPVSRQAQTSAGPGGPTPAPAEGAFSPQGQAAPAWRTDEPGRQPVLSEERGSDPRPPREKWNLVTVRAVVQGLDPQNREVLLKGEREKLLTVKASEKIDLDAIDVGDSVIAEFWSHMHAEFREPTAEEREEPRVVVAPEGEAPNGFPPGTMVGPVFRELVTVRAIDKGNRVVTVTGTRGKFMGVPVDDPSQLEGLTVGEPGVLTFAEPLVVAMTKMKG